MNILYLGVHYSNNETSWRTETFIYNAFINQKINVDRIDYRKLLKSSNGKEQLEKKILSNISNYDAVFIQRGEGIPLETISLIKLPIIFWSTEPINRNKDVDYLLNSNLFSWIYFHTYSCIERMEKNFPHLITKSSVLHNALAKEKINLTNNSRKYFSIFNRNVSWRRWYWLLWNKKNVKVIKGRYGDLYYKDLNNSYISVNIHYSSKSLDDFETGIFEAMASGCVVISEKIRNIVLKDLHLTDAIIQVNNPTELNEKLAYFNNNLSELKKYQTKSNKAIHLNTWDYRIKEIINKFNQLILK